MPRLLLLLTLRPSQGDFPLEETFFHFRRSLPILEEVAPTEEDLINDPSMVWILDELLTQRERWLSLRDPPDFVATDIATEGLRLFFKKDNKGIPLDPPLSDSRFPMTQFVTSEAKIPILKPFVEDWLGRNILTKSRLPPYLFLSRLFYVKKKNGKFRPILDLSRLNTFVQTPSFAMETLDRILKFVNQVMWAASLDVTDAYLSVPIHPDFQKYFCFLLDGVIFMFRRLPFGLTTAPWAFSRVMRPFKPCLRLRGVFCNLLFRRLPGSGRDESSLCSSLSLDGEAVDLVRFRHQLPKIFPCSFPVNRISRNPIELEIPHLSSPLRQGFQNPCHLSGVVKSHGDDPERARGPGGVTQLCPSYSVSGQDVASATHFVDERAFLPSLQGHSFSNRCWFKRGFASLPKCQVFSHSNLLSSSSSIPGSGYGRIRLRLEWGNWPHYRPRLLDAMGTIQFHQLARDPSDSQLSFLPSGLSCSQDYQDSYRQYGSLILFEENGFSSFRRDKRYYKAFTFIVSRTEYYICSCPHLRMSECSCRPSFKVGSNSELPLSCKFFLPKKKQEYLAGIAGNSCHFPAKSAGIF